MVCISSTPPSKSVNIGRACSSLAIQMLCMLLDISSFRPEETKHQLPGMYTYDIGKEMNPGNGVDLSAHGTASFARRTVLLYVLLCIDGADASIQLVHTPYSSSCSWFVMNSYIHTSTLCKRSAHGSTLVGEQLRHFQIKRVTHVTWSSTPKRPAKVNNTCRLLL